MRPVGTLTPKGASRNEPAWRSSRAPNTLGESKRGTHSQSIVPSGATSAPVWQSDRNPYSAIGVNGEGAAALCGIVALLSVGSAADSRVLVVLLAVRLFLTVVLMSPPKVDANVRDRK